MVCCAFVLDLLDSRHENCMVDSGSSARATQPFPSKHTTRCLSLSRCAICAD